MFHLYGKSFNGPLQIQVVYLEGRPLVLVNDQKLLFLSWLKDLIVSNHIAENYLLISRVHPATLVITCETMLPNSNHHFRTETIIQNDEFQYYIHIPRKYYLRIFDLLVFLSDFQIINNIENASRIKRRSTYYITTYSKYIIVYEIFVNYIKHENIIYAPYSLITL